MKSKSLIFKKVPIIGVILAVALFIAYRETTTRISDLYLIGSFSMLFCAVLIIYMYLFAGEASFANYKHGWHLGIRKCARLVIVHGALGCILSFLTIRKGCHLSSNIIKSTSSFLFSSLFVSAAIELLCRAIIPFGIIKQFKGTAKSIKCSTIITSIFFAFFTLYPYISAKIFSNVFSLVETFLCFGALVNISILLTACYITTRNLIHCIIVRYICVVLIHFYNSVFDSSFSYSILQGDMRTLISYAIYFIMVFQCSIGGFKMIKQIKPSRIQKYWCEIDDGKHHHRSKYRQHSSEYFDNLEFVDTGINNGKDDNRQPSSEHHHKDVALEQYEEAIPNSNHHHHHHKSKDAHNHSAKSGSVQNDSAEKRNHNRHAPWAD